MIKRFFWIVWLMLGLQASWAYSLLGPVANGPDAYQVTLIGYNPLPGFGPPYFVDGLLTGPKNLGEEYRRNTPVMYYACNANFLDYFGSNGVAAVDQAFDVLNNVFTNNPTGMTEGVDGYTASLSEFPLNSVSENYQANVLGLLDLKSETLTMMAEQLGLADAVRYIWALHDRYTPPGAACPVEDYLVIMRNFDITASPLNQVQYSPYVNSWLYTYSIIENCGAAGVSPPDADAMEIPVDPLLYNPPVASGHGEDSIFGGLFYNGLTRDDVAGLRYLLSSNNINTEMPAPGTLLESTNNPTILVTTSDLGALLTSAQINNPATLAALFPGVVAVSTGYFTNVLTPTVVIYTTNYYGEPYGTPPHVVTVTTYTTNFVTRYLTSFANVVTNSYQASSQAILLTTTFGRQIGAPYGSPFVTTTTTKTVTLTNVPTGDYYIIPAGSCGLDKVRVWQTNVVSTTNLIASATNPDGSSITQSLVTYYTNHVLELLPCTFVTPTPGLYQGIQKMQFVRANFDSLLGQFFQPVTNTYRMVLVTNSKAIRQTFQRVVIAPDFVFSAADLTAGPDAIPVVTGLSRNINFDQANILPGLAGPGVINSPTTFTFNKVGPNYLNVGTFFLNGPINLYNTPYWAFIWGSFDGTTNDPVVYPNGTSIANLEAAVLIQISPTRVPNGTHGVPYAPTTFTTTGGAFTPPYTWSAAGLPSGLTLSSGGTLSGTPTQSGTFAFIIQLNDSVSRSVQWSYSITIN